ncbi:MAG: hypothetical protein AAB281_00700 [Actinomycetota bacterium]
MWPDAEDKGHVPGDGSVLTISGRLLDPWGYGAPYVHIDAYLVLADGALLGYTPPAGTVNPYPCVSLFDNYCPPNPITDAAGNYSIAVGAPGMYKIFFNGMVALTTESTASMYWWERIRWPAAEWYNNNQNPGGATPVAAGSTGVDAILVPKGVLAGNVNSYSVLFAPSPDATAPNPPAVYVAAYRADREELVASAQVYSRTNLYLNVIHSFFFESLAPGEYKILATPDYSGWDLDYYGSQLMKPTWFGGAESWESARSVLVTGGPVSTIEIKMNEVGTGGTAVTASQTSQEPLDTGGGDVSDSNAVANVVSAPEPVVAATATAPEVTSASESATAPPVSNENASLPAPLASI